MGLSLLIFDCDGVLFESEEANIAFYDQVLRNAGVEAVDWAGEQATHELASAKLFERYFGERPDILAAIKEAAKATDYGPYFGLMRPRPGMRETLEALHRDHRIAMATNRSRTLNGVIEHFELAGLFDLAVGAYDVEHPKPHPEMIVKCVAELGSRPDESVYIGDQEIDRKAAAAAGVAFLATGPNFAGQDFHFDGLAELPGCLAAVGSAKPVEVVDQKP